MRTAVPTGQESTKLGADPAIGVNTTIAQVDPTQVVSQINTNHQFDAFITNGFNEAPTPDLLFDQYSGTSGNASAFDDPDFNAAFDAAATATDSDAQTAAYQQAMTALTTQVPAIYLVQKVGLFVWSNDRVGNVPQSDAYGIQTWVSTDLTTP